MTEKILHIKIASLTKKYFMVWYIIISYLVFTILHRNDISSNFLLPKSLHYNHVWWLCLWYCIHCTSQEYCRAGQLSVWNFWFPYPSNLECLLLLPWGLWLLKVYFKTLGLCLRFLQVVSFKLGEFAPRRWSQGGLLCEWEEKVEFSGVGGELCALGVKGKERHPCPPPK